MLGIVGVGFVLIIGGLLIYGGRQRLESLRLELKGRRELLGGFSFEHEGARFFVRSVGGPQGVAGNREGYFELLMELEKPWSGFWGRTASYKYFYLGNPSQDYQKIRVGDLDFLVKGIQELFLEELKSPDQQQILQEIFSHDYVAIYGRSQVEVFPQIRKKHYLILNWVEPEALKEAEALLKRARWIKFLQRFFK